MVCLHMYHHPPSCRELSFVPGSLCTPGSSKAQQERGGRERDRQTTSRQSGALMMYCITHAFSVRESSSEEKTRKEERTKVSLEGENFSEKCGDDEGMKSYRVWGSRRVVGFGQQAQKQVSPRVDWRVRHPFYFFGWGGTAVIHHPTTVQHRPSILI